MGVEVLVRVDAWGMARWSSVVTRAGDGVGESGSERERQKERRKGGRGWDYVLDVSMQLWGCERRETIS